MPPKLTCTQDLTRYRSLHVYMIGDLFRGPAQGGEPAHTIWEIVEIHAAHSNPSKGTRVVLRPAGIPGGTPVEVPTKELHQYTRVRNTHVNEENAEVQNATT